MLGSATSHHKKKRKKIKIYVPFLDITNILVVFSQIRQIEIFVIANPRYNEPISPIPCNWLFVKIEIALYPQTSLHRGAGKWNEVKIQSTRESSVMMKKIRREFSKSKFKKGINIFLIYV